MKLSEMKARCETIRAERDALHEDLHALLADDDISAGELRSKEAEIREKVKAINAEAYPMEVVIAKTRKVTKGTEMGPEEQAMYHDALALLGEPVELG